MDGRTARGCRHRDARRPRPGRVPADRASQGLAYQSTKRNGKDTDIYVVDPSDPGTERLLLQVDGGGWFAADWSPDAKTPLVGERISANESRYFLVDAATGARTLLTPEAKEEVAYGRAAFSKDGKKVFLTSDKDSEFLRLVAIDVAARTWEVHSKGLDWDVAGFDLAEDGSKVAFVVNEGGAETLRVLDLGTRREIPLPKLPLGTIGRLRFHPNSRDLGFSLASARSVSLDGAGAGDGRTLVFANTLLLRAASVS